MADEPFANPTAPVAFHAPTSQVKHDSGEATSGPRQPLTNDDFRKLMMTPRVGSNSASMTASTPRIPGSVRSSSKSSLSMQGRRRPVLQETTGTSSEKPHSKGHHDKTKKDFYKQKSKELKEDDILTELAQRYRDRAKERREGANPDYDSRLDDMDTVGRGHHRSIAAPDSKSRLDFQELRRREIEESKYLGGDMEHTHLVKGLDYALLQKVKAELKERDCRTNEQLEDDDQNDSDDEDDRRKKGKSNHRESRNDRHKSKGLLEVPETDIEQEVDEDESPKSQLAINIVSHIQRKLPDRNLMFLPMRMAYVVDLESEKMSDEVPLTLLRSKSDCPNHDSLVNPSTNDIVINKLIQIISSHCKEQQLKLMKKQKDQKAASSSSNNSFSWMSSKGRSSREEVAHDYKDTDTRKRKTRSPSSERSCLNSKISSNKRQEHQSHSKSSSLDHHHGKNYNSRVKSESRSSHKGWQETSGKTTTSSSTCLFQENQSIRGSIAFGMKAAADLDIYDDLQGCDYIPKTKKGTSVASSSNKRSWCFK